MNISSDIIFKFHYDSINSHTAPYIIAALRFYLNSIMILLIPLKDRSAGESSSSFKFHYDSINSIKKSQKNLFVLYLNSIMILLIQLELNPDHRAHEFKFHYDSINSKT